MRSGTTYPVLRRLAGLVAVLCYVGAAASVVVGYIASHYQGDSNPPVFFFAGLAGAVLLVVGGIAFKEVTAALLDIADATIDTAYVAWTSSDEVD